MCVSAGNGKKAKGKAKKTKGKSGLNLGQHLRDLRRTASYWAKKEKETIKR